MIDFTKYPRPLIKGEQMNFEALILTSGHVPKEKDFTNGVFYKNAVRANEAFRVYLISDIEEVYPGMSYVYCPYGMLGKDPVDAFLWLVLDSSVCYWGYGAIQIAPGPPPPRRN